MPRQITMMFRSQNAKKQIQGLLGIPPRPGRAIGASSRSLDRRSRPGFRTSRKPQWPARRRARLRLERQRKHGQNRERNAIIGARMRIQQHGNQHDHVAQQNGPDRLFPAHTARDQAGSQHVRGNADAHGHPERGVIVDAPSPPANRYWRKILVVKAMVVLNNHRFSNYNPVDLPSRHLRGCITPVQAEEGRHLFQRQKAAATEEPLAELLPPLTDHEALVEANRCLFCYDAPCTHACPTHIDIPRFIKKISTDNVIGSPTTILESNLLGATCARVCPVQELCEGACVLGEDHKPIMIGRLQRFATDTAERGIGILWPGAPDGKNGGCCRCWPCGALLCRGTGQIGPQRHCVQKRQFPGGLSTYGIITLREPVSVSLAEVESVRRLGVEFRTGASSAKT